MGKQKLILKFIWRGKRSRMGNKILKNQDGVCPYSISRLNIKLLQSRQRGISERIDKQVNRNRLGPTQTESTDL